MLHQFLAANRAELIERCLARGLRRSSPSGPRTTLEFGIPVFLEHVIETLRMEDAGNPSHSNPGRVSPTGTHVPTALATSAAKNGHQLLRDGFAVDQVVYHYGDLCQSITELATEKGTQVSTREFNILNRCLDDAIADAVTEFGWQRDQLIAKISTRAMSERLGFLAHELRNSLNTAILSFAVIKTGKVSVGGSTSAVLDRSLVGLRELIDRALAEVRLTAGIPPPVEDFDVAVFVAEVQVAAALEAGARGCTMVVDPVEAGVAVRVDKPMLYSAVSNLLQNAFKFTRRGSRVRLGTRVTPERVMFEVEDQCGGLAPGQVETMFVSFQQQGVDRSGLGLGLSIARQAVEANGGELRVHNLPGTGCVFTIDIPRSI